MMRACWVASPWGIVCSRLSDDEGADPFILKVRDAIVVADGSFIHVAEFSACAVGQIARGKVSGEGPAGEVPEVGRVSVKKGSVK